MMGMIVELIGGRRTLYGMAVGFIIGLFIGWVVLGMWLLPVDWKDAAPVDLHSDYQRVFVSAVADSYSIHGNAELAKAVLSERWETGDLKKIIGELKAETTDEVQVQRLDALALALGFSAAVGVEPTPKPPSGGSSLIASLLPLCGVFLVIVFVVVLAWLIMRMMRSRRARVERDDTLAQVQEIIAPEMAEVMPEGTVLGHFITSYAQGNDHYDDSFSIDTDAGEFLGECGVGIGETIGVGSPDKVTALEVWLFDKNDIRTETKVLMSAHAFHDEALRSKLAPKGEPVLAELFQVITLETASLQVTARITEMEYGNGGMPERSFFARVSIELVASLKQGSGGAGVEDFG
jgi:hypothetical protein